MRARLHDWHFFPVGHPALRKWWGKLVPAWTELRPRLLDLDTARGEAVPDDAVAERSFAFEAPLVAAFHDLWEGAARVTAYCEGLAPLTVADCRVTFDPGRGAPKARVTMNDICTRAGTFERTRLYERRLVSYACELVFRDRAQLREYFLAAAT